MTLIEAYPTIPNKMVCPKCGKKYIEIDAITNQYICGFCGERW